MRVTSKGQVTIPKEVRDRLGIEPGSEVGFREEDGQIILENQQNPATESPGERMVRLLTEFGRTAKRDPLLKDMSTDEIMEMLRGYSEDDDDPGFKRRP
jgi:AbrB family looped-hinge helix DNA binding protein